MGPFVSSTTTADVLPPIFEKLVDRKDLYSCALVSRTFNTASTPFLYRSLDSRVIKGVPFHPSAAILKKPKLALYVHHITETGTIHANPLQDNPNITKQTLQALRQCKNLKSLTWSDDSFTVDAVLLDFLDVLRNLPIRALTIRTHSYLGEDVWAQLQKLTGLQKVVIWCMEGPPRVLQGWSAVLGGTLTHLELGRCAGVPPTVLISVLSQLPLLRELRLKGAPSAAMPTILSYLPNLLTLHTEYMGSGNFRPPHNPLPRLRNLTIRTSSMDVMGPHQLWSWITRLLPYPSLESFTLHAFAMHGQMSIPLPFILALATTHRATLRQFLVGNSQITLNDIECLCARFPHLRELVCSVASPDADSLKAAIAKGFELRILKANVQWIPYDSVSRFTTIDAKELMLRKQSHLRVIGIGSTFYEGKWVLGAAGKLEFEITERNSRDSWI